MFTSLDDMSTEPRGCKRSRVSIPLVPKQKNWEAGILPYPQGLLL